MAYLFPYSQNLDATTSIIRHLFKSTRQVSCTQMPICQKLISNIVVPAYVYVTPYYWCIQCQFCSRMTVRYGALVRYGTPRFLLRSTVRWYGTPFFGMLRVRYVGTVHIFCNGTGLNFCNSTLVRCLN